MPDRLDRQLAAGRAREAPTRSTSSSRGTRCRRRRTSGLGAAPDIPQDIARITAEASAGQGGAAAPPWSAAHPYVNLHTLAQPAIATVTGNFALTAPDASSDIRHIVLDFGATAFPVLEGQTIGIIPPGTDAQGRPHYVRLYSVASPRDGERPATTTSRSPSNASPPTTPASRCKGVASNYLCDLAKGDTVQRRRAVRHELPHAEPPGLEPAHDLHGHRVGADARDDRAPAPAHRAKRKAAN